jgi:hypothetical protein
MLPKSKRRAELDAVFETASERRPDGLLMLTAPLFSIYSKHIAELTLKHRLRHFNVFQLCSGWRTDGLWTQSRRVVSRSRRDDRKNLKRKKTGRSAG